MKLKNWIRRSFRNRIFATILLVTLMPLLLCDVVMMRVIVARTEHTQAQQGQETLHALCACFDSAAALCGDTLDALATSTITRSVLRRTEQDSRLLYQFLYRRAAPLRPYAALDIYNAQGVCLYTTDTSLPARPAGHGLGCAVRRTKRQRYGLPQLRQGAAGGPHHHRLRWAAAGLCHRPHGQRRLCPAL